MAATVYTDDEDTALYDAADLALRTINDVLRHVRMSRAGYDALQDMAAQLHAALTSEGTYNYARYPYPWKD